MTGRDATARCREANDRHDISRERKHPRRRCHRDRPVRNSRGRRLSRPSIEAIHPAGNFFTRRCSESLCYAEAM